MLVVDVLSLFTPSSVPVWRETASKRRIQFSTLTEGCGAVRADEMNKSEPDIPLSPPSYFAGMEGMTSFGAFETVLTTFRSEETASNGANEKAIDALQKGSSVTHDVPRVSKGRS